MRSFNLLVIISLLCLAVAGIISTSCADTGVQEIGSWNPYQGWDMDLASKITGVFPQVEVSETPIPDSTDMPLASTNPDFWVKLAYYPAGSSSGQPAILAGYVGGNNFNSKVTIGAKKDASGDFKDLVTIKPQDNGVFVWAVPDKIKDVNFYQATAVIGGVPAKSDIVKISNTTAYAPAA
jgi:hypothetical protein